MAATIRPDFSEVPPSIPPGAYPTEIVGFAHLIGKTGTPYIQWKLKIATGEYQGRNVYHSTPTSGRGAGLFKRFVRRAYDPAYEEGEIDLGQLLGHFVRVTLAPDYDEDGFERDFPKVTNVEACPPPLSA